MAKKPVKYCLLDAFTDSAFKGNPAAVCLLEEERDEEWLQAVAREFNISETCYLTRLSDHSIPTFRLRWFTPVAEVKLCGHATLAASHFLFAYGLVKSDIIEFSTLSGILTAKRVPNTKVSDQNGNALESFLIELDFPVVPVTEYDGAGELSTISKSLNGASITEIHKTTTEEDLLVVLPSGEAVVEVEPQFDEIQKCPGGGIIITGRGPEGSRFDFFSRFFCPKLGINEDPVCGSAHCALASYWSKKLGKCDFIAYQASPRSGVLNLHLDEKNGRVLLRGKAVAVMEGSLLVDAFTDSAFKGNPAAVCLLEEERDDEWLQAVAREFNLPLTCYLTRLSDSAESIPSFRLRWFTPVVEVGIEGLMRPLLGLSDEARLRLHALRSSSNLTEVKLCGHGTLAASYFLFAYGLVKSDIIEFSTLSGILTAKRVPENKVSNQNGNAPESFLIELNFPVVPITEYNGADVLSIISKSLSGASITEIHKTTAEDLLVVLPSGEAVTEVEPQFDEIQKCPGRAIIITGLAPTGSGFDFFSRVFCPKMGINEDPVTGSVHCALAPYWSKKLGKCDFIAYQASPRSGVLNLHLDEKNHRVLLRGKAVAVMKGSLLVVEDLSELNDSTSIKSSVPVHPMIDR
ncbi:hypothetical protein BUALT_Bualt02G0221900 [Buddleja alternifolia]|uniref:Phenazine biosynthesis PhzC/PhzF protein n=1 Tax=Buddleja alternifolia TaxID=168488 RepID=A0AAV6Y8E1_9LAMI|nr:hypothetical protein BUALT_Bualt02G0221900 [Buddleja alternifolia]